MTTDIVRPRTYALDLLRGIACAVVVAFHYLSRGPAARVMSEAPLPSLEPVARYGFLGVNLFFMISGYVIFLSAIDRSPREFVASRVARLMPALWVAATITMLLLRWRPVDGLMISWADWAWNLTLVPQFVGAEFVDGAYWSLAVELQFYLLVWLVLCAGIMRRAELLLAGWLVLSLVDAVRPMDPVERWLIVNDAPLFVIGAISFLATRHGWTRTRIAMLIGAVPLGVWHGIARVHRTASEGSAAPTSDLVVGVVLLAAMALFLAVGAGRLTLPRTRWATVPGVLTYPVYLVHQVAGYVVYGAARAAGSSAIVSLGVACGFTMLAAAAIHRFVERPLGPRLRRLVRGRRGGAPALSASAD